MIDERVAPDPAARLANAAEEDDVVGRLDRLDQIAVEVRERLRNRRAQAVEIAWLDQVVEELRLAGSSCVRRDAHLGAGEELAPKAPVASIARALTVPRRARPAPWGSTDTDANAVTVIPHGRPAARLVTTTTPLASVLIASANSSVGAVARYKAFGGRAARAATIPPLYAAVWSTETGTPFVTMSKTAERCFARSTTSRSFSSGALPATRNVTLIRSKPLR